MITVLFGWMSLASAADLTVQARLLDVDGAPVQDGTTLTVQLLDSATDNPPAATVLYETTAVTPTLTDGYVSVVLSDVPETVLGVPAWVAFTVDGSAMGARQPLNAVPLAAAAEWVVTPADALQLHQGALRMPDGTSLASCAAYAADPVWRGEDWQRFWIDPDGAGAIAPMPLLCDMAGGGWAVWQAQGGPWGWDRDGTICYDIEVFTEGQAWQMSRYTHSEHQVFTDTDFYFQEDDSTNTGAVYARTFASVANAAAFDASTAFGMDYTTSTSNNVHIDWSPNGFDRIRASCSAPANGCGRRNIPSSGADTVPVFLTRIDANPNCSSSSGSPSSRNATAFQGSRYEIRLR